MEKWSTEKVAKWYGKQPWLVGANYIPSNAANQLEMWQKDTFDRDRIELELGWAEKKLGMNTMRVFLHDKLWEQDPEGFIKRIKTFLTIADKHHIKPMFVLFDSCWNPNSQLGKQPVPKEGLHNSCWVQSPDRDVLENQDKHPHLEEYVKGIMKAFGHDSRVLAWDLYNEPCNPNEKSYAQWEAPEKQKHALNLMKNAFKWAREMAPEQPLTSAPWRWDYKKQDALSPMEDAQLNLSDVISFHNYGSPQEFAERIESLKQKYDRPVFCTEYMARAQGNTFQDILPILKKHKVAAFNWGFVQGKSQTNVAWDTAPHGYMADTYTADKAETASSLWFHDIFHADGKPYSQGEVAFIKAEVESAKQHSLNNAHAENAYGKKVNNKRYPISDLLIPRNGSNSHPYPRQFLR